jgi:hypothetical protein
MNPREQRGVIIAALCKLTAKDGQWVVPSQTASDKRYMVDVKAGTCTCPDQQETGFKCKHLYAVEFTMKREQAADGTVTETKTLTFTEKKVYRQVWPAYNAAQATEKERLQVLLHDLCRNLPEPERPAKPGPKPHLARDAVFAMAFKVYCGFSARRFSTDLLEAHKRGFVTRPIPGMKVTAFHECDEYTPILAALIAK